MIDRKTTRQVRVKDKFIGGGAPVLVQSMTNTKTCDVAGTLAQIKRLEEAGCELVRCGVPDMESARALGEIVRGTHLPICADIHFDWRLALESLEQGVHKLRINPGNIGDSSRVQELASACRKRSVPIRVGVNGGSMDRDLLKKYRGVTPEALVESALGHVRILEEADFNDVVVSIKASSVELTVEACRLFSRQSDVPLHLGITEAGTPGYGTVKSAIGIGIMLYDGIGDTIRVSLTGDPVGEVRRCWDILKALGIRRRGPEVIACPTCARTCIDVETLAKRVEKLLENCPHPIKIAVMGCVVNGPGEAREAHVGIAGGKKGGVIFRRGEQVRTLHGEPPEEALMDEVRKFIREEYEDR